LAQGIRVSENSTQRLALRLRSNRTTPPMRA